MCRLRALSLHASPKVRRFSIKAEQFIRFELEVFDDEHAILARRADSYFDVAHRERGVSASARLGDDDDRIALRTGRLSDRCTPSMDVR
jgi:hypothetical protein